MSTRAREQAERNILLCPDCPAKRFLMAQIERREIEDRAEGRTVPAPNPQLPDGVQRLGSAPMFKQFQQGPD